MENKRKYSCLLYYALYSLCMVYCASCKPLTGVYSNIDKHNRLHGYPIGIRLFPDSTFYFYLGMDFDVIYSSGSWSVTETSCIASTIYFRSEVVDFDNIPLRVEEFEVVDTSGSTCIRVDDYARLRASCDSLYLKVNNTTFNLSDSCFMFDGHVDSVQLCMLAAPSGSIVLRTMVNSETCQLLNNSTNGIIITCPLPSRINSYWTYWWNYGVIDKVAVVRGSKLWIDGVKIPYYYSIKN